MSGNAPPIQYNQRDPDDRRSGTVFLRMETDAEMQARLQKRFYMAQWEKELEGERLDRLGEYYGAQRKIIEDTSHVPDE